MNKQRIVYYLLGVDGLINAVDVTDIAHDEAQCTQRLRDSKDTPYSATGDVFNVRLSKTIADDVLASVGSQAKFKALSDIKMFSTAITLVGHIR